MAVFSSLLTALGASTATGAVAAGATGAATGATAAAGGIGTALSAIGTAAGVAGQFMSASAAKKAEKLREAQMNVEATRQRRQIVRQAIVARSEALSSATAQGAAEGSGLAGGLAQIQSQSADNITGVNFAQQLGQQMFAANRRAATAQTVGSFGSGLQSLGGALVRRQDELGRLSTYYGTA